MYTYILQVVCFLQFSHQKVYVFLFSLVHATCPAYLNYLHLIAGINNSWGVQIMQLRSVQFSLILVTFSFLDANTFLNTPFSKPEFLFSP